MVKDIFEFGLEVIEAEIGPEGEPVVFDFAPEDFDQVEFGAIGRQPMQGDALAEPIHHPRLESAAGVDGGVVEDDEAQFLRLSGLGGEGVQHGDGGGRGDRTGHSLKVTLVGGTDQAHDIQAGAGRAGDRQGLAPGLPGIRYNGHESETALVEVKHVDDPLGVALPQFCQARVRRPKGDFIAGAFDPSAAALPAVGFF